MRELSLHILDVIENALEAGASRIEVEIDEDTARNVLAIRVADNGRGMDEETLRRVTDPFFTTRQTRHVGLGLPLFKAAAERCNGGLTITSQPGKGTEVRAIFQYDHIDRAPLGDMPATLLGAILSHHACDIAYRHRVDGQTFTFDTAELREALGGLPLSHPQVRAWLEAYLQEGIQSLYAETGMKTVHPLEG
ncbi:MAG: ATP-binding protein [Chloroflexi bacterium]|nr:ATP-binding protein [Chloroflexota bacterium]